MHPAIELMLARIESNPEEFIDLDPLNYRWGQLIARLEAYATEEDYAVLNEKLRQIRLDSIHKDIMQELCAPTQEKLDYTIRPHALITSAKMMKDAKKLLQQQVTK